MKWMCDTNCQVATPKQVTRMRYLQPSYWWKLCKLNISNQNLSKIKCPIPQYRGPSVTDLKTSVAILEARFEIPFHTPDNQLCWIFGATIFNVFLPVRFQDKCFQMLRMVKNGTFTLTQLIINFFSPQQAVLGMSMIWSVALHVSLMAWLSGGHSIL